MSYNFFLIVLTHSFCKLDYFIIAANISIVVLKRTRLPKVLYSWKETFQFQYSFPSQDLWYVGD